MPSTSRASPLDMPSTSRKVTISRWRGGSVSRAARSNSAIRPATSRSSASSIQCSGGAVQAPSGPNRDASTTGVGSSIGMLRCSLVPVVRARLTRMVNTQVRSDDRPSNPLRPRKTASQVSWTTSSATARLGT